MNKEKSPFNPPFSKGERIPSPPDPSSPWGGKETRLLQDDSKEKERKFH